MVIFLLCHFVLGYTDDLELVVNDLIKKNPEEKLVGIGFSLGANVLMKFLGEKPERQLNFLFAASLCQGYNLPEYVFILHFCNLYFSIFIIMLLFFCSYSIKLKISFNRCITLMSEWENLRKLYYFGITRNMLKVINHHKEKFEDHSIKNNISLDWKRISSAKALHELDNLFTA